MIVTIGIDPGQTGGIAWTTKDREHYFCERYPGDITMAATTIRGIVLDQTVKLAVIEKVHAMPKQGVSSTFKFGANFGGYLGILAALGIPHVLVTPRSWQKVMLDAGTGETKARSLNYARRLFPDADLKYKIDNGKADALHLARYGWTVK